VKPHDILTNLVGDLLNADFPEEPADAANCVGKHWNAMLEAVNRPPQQPGSPQQGPSDHEDSQGQPLYIGDTVIFLGGYGSCLCCFRVLKRGSIVRLGPVKATVLADSAPQDTKWTDIVYYAQLYKP